MQRAGDRVDRRLAAILVANVVGYSRLMAADETGTVVYCARGPWAAAAGAHPAALGGVQRWATLTAT
jgi:class 3 adenylate cyclase